MQYTEAKVSHTLFWRVDFVEGKGCNIKAQSLLSDRAHAKVPSVLGCRYRRAQAKR